MKTIIKYKKAEILFLFCIITLILNGQDYNFRKTKWGLSKNEVIGTESTKSVEEGSKFLIYKYELAGLPCQILYYFSNENKLINAKYVFRIENENYEKCIKDYDFFKKLLTEKYKKPASDQRLWIHDPIDKSEINWANDLSEGNLKFITQWDLPKTALKLTLNNINNLIYMIIDYSSKDFKENLSPGDKIKIMEAL